MQFGIGLKQGYGVVYIYTDFADYETVRHARDREGQRNHFLESHVLVSLWVFRVVFG